MLEVPAPYAEGLFAAAARYPVHIRLSTSPGDVLNDKIATSRGFAMKVRGMPRRRLDGPPGATTQDILRLH